MKPVWSTSTGLPATGARLMKRRLAASATFTFPTWEPQAFVSSLSGTTRKSTKKD